jgi:hypothetical protein
LTNSTIPPAPTGVAAAGAFNNIVITWDAHNYANFSFAEVWRGATSTLANATVIGTTNGVVFADATGEDESYYYWVRFVSNANVAGAFNSAGVSGSTISLAPAKLVLSDPTGGSNLIPFKTVTTAYCSGASGSDQTACEAAGGTWIPVGTYMDATYIEDASIASAKIASLAADKIVATSAWIDTADIVDAAITNAKVGSAAITTAKIGSAAITTAKIGNAQVDTLQVAGQAITIPSSAHSSTTAQSSSTTYSDILSLSFTSSGSPVSVFYSIEIQGGYGVRYPYTYIPALSPNYFCNIRLLRGSTTLWELLGLNYPIAGAISDTPGSGSVTYKLQASFALGYYATQYTIGDRSIVCIETKR